MIDKAGGGDFVVVRATGSDGYNQYIYDMGGVDSVESLVIPTLEATNHPFVSKFSTDRLLRGPSEKKLFPGDALHADHRTTRCLLKFDRTRSIVRIQILIPVRPLSAPAASTASGSASSGKARVRLNSPGQSP
jgi:hypothetical protein